MQIKTGFRLLLVALSMFALTACRQSSQPQNTVELNIDLTIEPDPPVIGESVLVLVISDAQGQPINDAQVDVRGDMTHAGMVPVLREVENGENGVYRVPFEWTMGGDWFVVVTVTLADGNVSSQRFEVSNVLASAPAPADGDETDSDMDDMEHSEAQDG